MKIYLVFQYGWEFGNVVAVFTSRKMAEKVCKRCNKLGKASMNCGFEVQDYDCRDTAPSDEELIALGIQEWGPSSGTVR